MRVLPLTMMDDVIGMAKCGNKSLTLNTHIEMKKLKFHKPDKNGRTKCFKLHVGNPNRYCPDLLVYGTPMSSVKSEVYLGQIIPSNGSNSENILNRISKATGAISDIMHILECESRCLLL